jgi:adenine-specific DNA-methyltransferase
MTTTFRNNGASCGLKQLSEIIEKDKWALPQILLSLSTDKTLNRIVFCPTYPAKVFTRDLQEMLSLFKGALAKDPFEISNVLSYLFERATEIGYRKNHGQYFTPSKVAEETVKRLDLKKAQNVLEPGCGTGIFPTTILKIYPTIAETTRYIGVEEDPLLALSTALSLEWVRAPQTWKVFYANFMDLTTSDFEQVSVSRVDVVVSNPPFVRFHRLGKRKRTTKLLGLTNMSGLHSYFLARAASFIGKGKMVFILPSEMNKTHYGLKLFGQLQSRFTVERLGIYYKDCDFSIAPIDKTAFQAPEALNPEAIIAFFVSRDGEQAHKTQPEMNAKRTDAIPLKSMASVHRGISTGVNDFFLLTETSASALMIPQIWLKEIVPTKIPMNVIGKILTEEKMEDFRKANKHCYLLSIDPKMKFTDLPEKLKQYIREGEARGLHTLATSKARHPWYCVKTPKRPPDLFFTYMFRRAPRFVVNEARAFILTNLLGIYFHESGLYSEKELVELASILNSSVSEWIQSECGYRLYAGGLMKFEPHDLEEMPINSDTLRKASLPKFKSLLLM